MTTTPADPVDPDWYQVTTGSGLEQGDLLPGCRVPIAIETAPVEEGATFDVDVRVVDLVVLTQSCDLEHDKVSTLLLGRVYTWEAVVESEISRGNQKIKSKDTRVQLQRGAVPNFCLLHRRTQPPELTWSVVDFHQLHTLSAAAVRKHAEELGPRLRLRSPYKEHVAQAFARYFMRVGLPLDAAAFLMEVGTK